MAGHASARTCAAARTAIRSRSGQFPVVGWQIAVRRASVRGGTPRHSQRAIGRGAVRSARTWNDALIAPPGVTSKRLRWIRWSTTKVSSTWNPVVVRSASGAGSAGPASSACRRCPRPVSPAARQVGGLGVSSRSRRISSGLRVCADVAERGLRIVEPQVQHVNQLSPGRLVVPYQACGAIRPTTVVRRRGWSSRLPSTAVTPGGAPGNVSARQTHVRSAHLD